MGIIVFVDDYLNALAVGIAMRNITDKYKVPRTFLGYVITSTGTNVCALIPIGSWGAYMMGMMLASGLYEGPILNHYLQVIPFLFYGWLSLIFVPLYILKIVPQFGPIKKDWRLKLSLYSHLEF